MVLTSTCPRKIGFFKRFVLFQSFVVIIVLSVPLKSFQAILFQSLSHEIDGGILIDDEDEDDDADGGEERSDQGRHLPRAKTPNDVRNGNAGRCGNCRRTHYSPSYFRGTNF